MPSSQQQPPNTPWQDRLAVVCRECQIEAPIFQIVSDRRGGRTAWSSAVTVYGKRIEARYWYDGRNLTNAREDAAEAALNWLTSQTNLTTNW
ncbi:uncharacterized protein GGS25DRAFT_521171 [Hypoxylon fragiforme]|uniref:uncharacterized protein n=1 Tax=Hypoxylon fragiforme TaxID=63214 RepID=UPI0020C60BBB|nr:uncharacterized protein GGS25DRAFT_521171 [Hypoxylon fragiforme]KAI2610371.1 hypothetical protein GGS25DRAFT_521171 [Hypoxylon fragiforme]